MGLYSAYANSCATTMDSLPSVSSIMSTDYVEEITKVTPDITDPNTCRAIELMLLYIQDVKTSMLKHIDAKVDTAMMRLEHKSWLETPSAKPAVAKLKSSPVMEPKQVSQKFEQNRWCPIPAPKLVPRVTPSLCAAAREQAFSGTNRAALPLTSRTLTPMTSTPVSTLAPETESLLPFSARISICQPVVSRSVMGVSPCKPVVGQCASEASPNPALLTNSCPASGVRGVTDVSNADSDEETSELPMWLQISASMPTRNM